jgi:hypothetical protein
VIISNPRGKNPLDFGKELKKIKDALEQSADRGNYRIELEPGVIKDDLAHLLDKYKPDYLHITLHSSFTDGLYFESKSGEPAAMSSEEFAKIVALVSGKRRPQVIVLSACNSKAHAEAVKTYCGYSIGMNAVFPERASIVYAQRFYEMLFNDNYTDIPYCHKAAILGIEQTVPAFEPEDGVPVQNIPVLINI